MLFSRLDLIRIRKFEDLERQKKKKIRLDKLTQLNFLLRLLLFFSIVVVVIAMRVFTLLLISARSSYLDVIYNSLRTMALNMYELVVLFFNILDKLTTERNALKQ